MLINFRLAGKKAQLFLMKKHPKVLYLQSKFKPNISEAEKDMAIHQYITNTYYFYVFLFFLFHLFK